MAITDELREWARNNTMQDKVLTTYPEQHPVHGTVESLLRIADRIDAAHEEALGSKVAMAISVGEDGTESVSMPAKELSERYIELPKDADGVPIRFGDKITVPWRNRVYEVAGFSCSTRLAGGETTIWIDVYEPDKQRLSPLCAVDGCHHYRKPSVEDVLREFANECLTYATCVDDHEVTDAIELYAAKLRLVGDAE